MTGTEPQGFRVELGDGQSIGLEPCCPNPEPALRVLPLPVRSPEVRHQRLECVNCRTCLVDLSWRPIPRPSRSFKSYN